MLISVTLTFVTLYFVSLLIVIINAHATIIEVGVLVQPLALVSHDLACLIQTPSIYFLKKEFHPWVSAIGVNVLHRVSSKEIVLVKVVAIQARIVCIVSLVFVVSILLEAKSKLIVIAIGIAPTYAHVIIAYLT